MFAVKLSSPGLSSPRVISYLDSRTNAITENVHMDDTMVLSTQKLHIFVSSDQLEPHQYSQQERGVPLVPWYEGTKSFTPSLPKNWFFVKHGQIWHFWPIWSPARPKNNTNKVSRGFSVMQVLKLFIPPLKFRTFGPKTAKFGPKLAFLVHLIPCPTKKQCKQSAKVPKLGFLVPNRLSWAHIGLAGSFCDPLVDGCGARAVSRKTPIYFILFKQLYTALTLACMPRYILLGKVRTQLEWICATWAKSQVMSERSRYPSDCYDY